MWKYLKNAHGGTDAFGSLSGVEGSSERSEPRGATAAVAKQGTAVGSVQTFYNATGLF
jgi:hypothetical protein